MDELTVPDRSADYLESRQIKRQLKSEVMQVKNTYLLYPSGCPDHDVRNRLLQRLLVLCDRDTAVEITNGYALHPCAKPRELVANL